MGCVFFFFFKQKTAYEIYQCDWSSDVCSSDLKYVKSASKIGKAPKRVLEVKVAYKERNIPKIKDIVRVSKLSKRIYNGAKDIKFVKRGYGVAVLSTSKGIMTDKEAKKAKVGGEVLFKVW